MTPRLTSKLPPLVSRLAVLSLSLAAIPCALRGATTTLPSVQGSVSSPASLQPTVEPAPEDIVHGFVNLDFTDHHLTSRGVAVQNKGLVTQQTLRLDWVLYHPPAASNSPIDEVTFTTALWNDIDTHSGGADNSNWNEIDPTVGPNVRFLKDWTFESEFIAYVSETSSYPTCWVWDPRLTYHDHFIKDFSINPYVEFYDELDNTIVIDPVPNQARESYYGVLGIDPTYAFENIPLKLELPTNILIPGDQFYQRANGTGGGTDMGLFSTTFKATVPLECISPSFGKWSVYGAVQYDYLNNPGLLDGNQFAGANLSRERNIVVFHGGVTFRF